MKITITTPSNDPYYSHITNLSDLLKRALARFARSSEGDVVYVVDDATGVEIRVEENHEESNTTTRGLENSTH